MSDPNNLLKINRKKKHNLHSCYGNLFLSRNTYDMQSSMTQGPQRNYMTVDFESVNQQGKWLCYGIVVSEYPSGRVLESHVGKCEREYREYDAKTLEFWTCANPLAFQVINSYPSKPVNVAELDLCSTIRRILRDYPRIFVVSDNPQYDIRILDNILVNNGYPVVSNRLNGIYLQSICTWTFLTAAMQIYNVTRKQILSPRSDREVDHKHHGVHHTPITDCSRILAHHFTVLDFIRFQKENK